MLDKIEYRVAANLADYHLYPYGREIYINIFRKFSHFPLRLEDLGIERIGDTITFIAYVAQFCLGQKKEEFLPFYRKILTELEPTIRTYFPFNISVETLLGCILFYYHPVDIKNTLSSLKTDVFFDEKEQYEYELKKKTLLIHAI